MNKTKYLQGLLVGMVLCLSSCNETEYSLGDLTTPSNIVITADVVGKDATHPDGDGSGDVKFTITANNALSYRIDYDASTPVDMVNLPTGKVTKKFTNVGVHTYTVTAFVYGAGGVSSIVTKDVKVRSDFTPAAEIVTNLTNNSTKTWVIDRNVPGHFGVGPWDVKSIKPEWWSAGVNEKKDQNCFYSASFTFSKVAGTGNYELKVETPEGAFTKTGALTQLPGISATGDEGCYAYGGGTSSFSFVPASSGAPAVASSGDNSPSTQTAILLSGVNTFIGYGAVLKEYEILTIDSGHLYLRVQGTETGNAWYMKLIPKP